MILSFVLPVLAPPRSLVGRYQGWVIMNGNASPIASAGMTQNLDLRPDGTFVWELHTRVMMNLDQSAKGTYRVDKGWLQLDGKVRSKMDDGYKKENENGPFHLALHVEPAGLILRKVSSKDVSLLRKVGDGPPPVPTHPKPRPSDPAATAPVRQVERRYAALRSYADEGAVKSNGEGFQPERARFSTRFVRPNGFRFSADYLAPYGGPTEAAVWIESGKSWLAASDSPAKVERPLGNGLGILAVDAGQEAELVPALLMPDHLGSSLLKEYSEVHALPDETIDAHPCAVLTFWKDRTLDLTLWVDRSSLLVRRAHYKYADETVTLHPQANVALPASDLLPSESLRRGKT